MKEIFAEPLILALKRNKNLKDIIRGNKVFRVRFVVFNIKVPQLIDSESGGTTTKVTKGMQQMGEHPSKTISINIF